MPIVFCKPDALYGPRAAVAPKQATGFLLALAAACDGTPTALPDPTRAAVERAATQVAERAMTEPAFRGSPVDVGACAAALREAAANLPHTARIRTADVVRWGVERLGFRVEVSSRHICRAEDVDGVYAATTATAHYADVRSDLLDYLEGKEILVWQLAGRQDPCVLQWWKTFARHLLMDREDARYLLRNLVHVCEESDARYLTCVLHDRPQQ